MDKLLSLVTMGEENDPFWTGNECLTTYHNTFTGIHWDSCNGTL